MGCFGFLGAIQASGQHPVLLPPQRHPWPSTWKLGFSIPLQDTEGWVQHGGKDVLGEQLPLFLGKDDIARQIVRKFLRIKVLDQSVLMWAHTDRHSKVSSGLANQKLLFPPSICLSFSLFYKDGLILKPHFRATKI